MLVVIHSRAFSVDKQGFFGLVIDVLLKLDQKVMVTKPTLLGIEKIYQWPDNMFEVCEGDGFQEADVVISLGGDGTLLEAITLIGRNETPILGINAGRLGFLATTSPNEVESAIMKFLTGEYILEKRTLIKLNSELDYFQGLNYGLNEFTILKRDTSSMIIVHTYIDGVFLASYWADGLIVSTPTGSTGYSLSVGGPVVSPECNNFIISPVSPHNLSLRPLVVSDQCSISFEIEGRSKNFMVSLDSRSVKVSAGTKLSVQKADFHATLVRLNGDNFLDTLKQKLRWGYDVRN